MILSAVKAIVVLKSLFDNCRRLVRSRLTIYLYIIYEVAN